MTRMQLWLIQIAGVLVAAALAYAWADSRGYKRCQAEHAAKVADANVALVDGERKRDAESDDIAGEADERASGAVRDAETATADAEERIKVVYRDRWRDPEPGRCAVPLDPRVQAEIDAAVRRSNEEK